MRDIEESCPKCKSDKLAFYDDFLDIEWIVKDGDIKRAYTCQNCDFEAVKSYTVTFDGDWNEKERWINK